METSDVRQSDVRQRFSFFAGRKKELRDEEPHLGSSFLLRHLCKCFSADRDEESGCASRDFIKCAKRVPVKPSFGEKRPVDGFQWRGSAG